VALESAGFDESDEGAVDLEALPHGER